MITRCAMACGIAMSAVTVRGEAPTRGLMLRAMSVSVPNSAMLPTSVKRWVHEAPSSKKGAEQALDELFQRNHGQHQREPGQHDRDDELDDRLPSEWKWPHPPDHVEAAIEIGEGLDIGAAHKRFVRGGPAVKPLAFELFHVAVGEDSVLAEAAALGLKEVRREHH